MSKFAAKREQIVFSYRFTSLSYQEVQSCKRENNEEKNHSGGATKSILNGTLESAFIDVLNNKRCGSQRSATCKRVDEVKRLESVDCRKNDYNQSCGFK